MYTTRRLVLPAHLSEIFSIIWQLHVLSVLEFSLHLGDVSSVDVGLGGSKDWGLNESKVGLAIAKSVNEFEFKLTW